MKRDDSIYLQLKPLWQRAWSALGVNAPPDEVYAGLEAHYAEPHRAYHTPRHLEECFAQLEPVREQCQHPAEVEVALWFHDAIYDTHASDNEARSADLAAWVLSGVGAPEEVIERVRGLVLATQHQAAVAPGDAAIVVDVDLAILGAAPARFDEYEAQVRQEYAWVPEEMFRQVRAGILRDFLARPSIYETAWFRARLEQPARANLERSLWALEAPARPETNPQPEASSKPETSPQSKASPRLNAPSQGMSRP